MKAYDELNAISHNEKLVSVFICVYRYVNSPIKVFNEVITVGYFAKFAYFRFL